MANSFKEINFKAKALAIDMAFKTAILIIAKDAIVTFKRNFSQEGFTDETFEHWKPRKGKINSLGAKALGRKTLTKTGKLRRSIRYVRGINGYSAKIISDLPYSQIHNEGGRINKDFNRKEMAFNAHGRFTSKSAHSRKQIGYRLKQVTINEHSINMPKRQFMGRSSRLERLSLSKIKAKIKTAFKNA